jgi:hypothetical protein
MPSQWGYQPPNAVDPSVGPGVSYTYWVEALMADGSVTAPSPVSAVDALAPSYFPNPIPSNLFNLQASVSGTRPTVMPGMLAIRGAISGSEVTWTWNPLQYGLIYNVSYEIVGGLPGVGAVFERWTVPFVSDVNSNPGPVVTRAGVPQGRLVKFCMSLVPDPDPAKPLPYASCLTTQVP